MNGAIINTNIKMVMKIFIVNKIQGPKGFMDKFYEPFRELLTQAFLEIFQYI